MNLETIIMDTVTEAVNAALTEAIRDMVKKEINNALREYDHKLTILVRTAVMAALEEILK